ncbi:isocitrate lyase/phosphoenolpyruvate mutase family protein [Agrococcus lahaulensis]|nr:isocitrate lyase/phosphoenolpyruvate mutase family protein [Agrococcus lahaulensis]
MPNPWDLGSARILERLGFPALATTSAGSAWALGMQDARLALDESLAHLSAVAAAVAVPVSADFQGGYAVEPDAVAGTVAVAVETGVAGLSIEDATGDAGSPLHERALAVERIRAAREAIDRSGTRVLLTARSEGYVVGHPDLDDTIDRLVAYAQAGADCLGQAAEARRCAVSTIATPTAATTSPAMPSGAIGTPKKSHTQSIVVGGVR